MEDLETAPPMWSMAGRVMLGDTGDMDNLTSAGMHSPLYLLLYRG